MLERLYQRGREDFSLESTLERQLNIYETILRRQSRKKGRRDGALVCGAYGRGNAGDDAILEAIVTELRQIDPDLPIWVLSRNPDDTRLTYRVNSIYTFAFPRFLWRMRKTHLYINGGGSGDEGEGGASLGSTTARFQPENEIRGIPAGRVMDTAVMDLINTVQLENSGADVSAAALFKGTSDLPKGDINYGNIFDIYKFDNTLYRVKVTGAELKAYMEWSAECYNQWQEGDINISFDPVSELLERVPAPRIS